MKIIDCHTHWWKEIGFFPSGFQRDIAVVLAKSTFPNRDPNEVLLRGEGIGSNKIMPLDPDGSGLLKDAKEMGIDVSVIQPMDCGMTWREDAALPIEEINKAGTDLAKKHPGKVYSFCGVDPRRPNAVRLFEKAVTEWGAKGLKLYPPCGFYPNDPKCFPLYQKAVELRVPVLQHTGFTFLPSFRSDPAHPKYIEDVAMDFPDLNIIIAHSGIQTPSSYAWWENAVGIAWSHYNIYLDISGWSDNMVLTRNIPQLIRTLRVQCDTVGAHRILFGTDRPGYTIPDDRDAVFKYIEILKNLVEVGREHGTVFSQEEVELILGGNAERIIGV